MYHQGNISSVLSSTSEADALKLLENISLLLVVDQQVGII